MVGIGTDIILVIKDGGYKVKGARGHSLFALNKIESQKDNVPEDMRLLLSA